MDHIDRVVELAGIDHVGIGSDYDGVGDSLPYGLKDVSSYPNLIFHLLKRGYSEDDIQKICYKNIWRGWSAVEMEGILAAFSKVMETFTMTARPTLPRGMTMTMLAFSIRSVI